KTLDVRVRRQNENALALAQWSEARPEFAAVHYPGLPSHPDHAIAEECLDGYGGMMSVEVAGGGPAADRFLRNLQLVTHAPSLGGVDTLVSEPRYTSHTHLTPEDRALIGIPDGFLRFSIGIEDVGDIIADFEQALR
ncbi:MAG: PLP-dependent transferase, partial [Gemmatimonadaceae bacterium]